MSDDGALMKKAIKSQRSAGGRREEVRRRGNESRSCVCSWSQIGAKEVGGRKNNEMQACVMLIGDARQITPCRGLAFPTPDFLLLEILQYHPALSRAKFSRGLLVT
jgi:hypothetical protein